MFDENTTKKKFSEMMNENVQKDTSTTSSSPQTNTQTSMQANTQAPVSGERVQLPMPPGMHASGSRDPLQSDAQSVERDILQQRDKSHVPSCDEFAPCECIEGGDHMEEQQSQPPAKSGFLSSIGLGDKSTIAVIGILIVVIICILAFVVYRMIKRKRYQKELMCKEADLQTMRQQRASQQPPCDDGFNEIEDFEDEEPVPIRVPKRKHSRQQQPVEELDEEEEEVEPEPIRRNQRTRVPMQHNAKGGFAMNDAQDEQASMQAQQMQAQQMQVNDVQANMQARSLQAQQMRANNVQASMRAQPQQSAQMDDNEFITDVPHFNDAPRERKDTVAPQLTQQQMIKHVLNNRAIEANNRKQQALSLQQAQEEERDAMYAKENEQIAGELGLVRGRGIDTERIKSLLAEQQQSGLEPTHEPTIEQVDETQESIPQPESSGIIDQSLILSAN